MVNWSNNKRDIYGTIIKSIHTKSFEYYGYIINDEKWELKYTIIEKLNYNFNYAYEIYMKVQRGVTRRIDNQDDNNLESIEECYRFVNSIERKKKIGNILNDE